MCSCYHQTKIGLQDILGQQQHILKKKDSQIVIFYNVSIKSEQSNLNHSTSDF